MNRKLLFHIAKTHLLSRIKQSGIAALGVTFGITMFITLVSFMTGLNKLLDDLILNRTPHIRFYNEISPSDKQPVQLSEEYMNDFNVINSIKPKFRLQKIYNSVALTKTLKNDSRVYGIAPKLSAQVFYNSGTIEINGSISGIDVEAEERLFSLSNYVTEGKIKDLETTGNSIILGHGIAEKMSAKIGDMLQITTAKGDRFRLKVVGIYRSGLAEIDNVQSFASLKTVRTISGYSNDYITDLNVKLVDLEMAPEMAKEYTRLFDVNAIDIQTANAQFETGTSIRNIITYAVSFTLLLVAGFGIYNILNMVIYEKMNDIAILKATGFSGTDVQMIFLMQALMIGIIGGVVGLILGFGFSTAISHAPFETEAMPNVKTFPVNFNPMYYVGGITFALITTFFAGWLPSRRAAKIDPVEIIRGK